MRKKTLRRNSLYDFDKFFQMAVKWYNFNKYLRRKIGSNMENNLNYILLKNEQLNTLFIHECDTYFYQQVQEARFSDNHEIYAIAYKAFTQNGSGGEYVFSEDENIGFISSKGNVGRAAKSLDGEGEV